MWYVGKEYESDVKHNGKIALITGANSGIGYETAKFLYNKGAHVFLLCRNEAKANEAIEKIQQTSQEKNIIKYKHLDLTDLTSVRRCAQELLEELKEIHLLINNAGVSCHAEMTTKDGFEIHMGTNYFGPFLLTLLLLPRLMSSSAARIINVASIVEQLPFIGGQLDLEDLSFSKQNLHPLAIYGRSKVALVLFTKELARKLDNIGVKHVTTYSLNPGFLIATEIGQNLNSVNGLLFKFWNYFKHILFFSNVQGAATTLYCALEENVKEESGFHYKGFKKHNSHSITYNEELAKQLWDLSIKLVKLESDPFTSYKNK